MGSAVPLLDFAALICFVGGWSGYVVYAKRRNLTQQHGLLAAMNRVREQWAEALLERDVRIVDSQVINGLIRKEIFFASTTLLILASIIALLGLGEQVNRLFREVPFAQQTPLALWELKVAVLALIFVFAFFKFTWSIRQHSACGILLASIPLPDSPSGNNGREQAQRLVKLSSLAARHFNDGLRAFYFSLAELSWFYHPIAFFVTTIWVILVLYRREFHSKTLAILS